MKLHYQLLPNLNIPSPSVRGRGLKLADFAFDLCTQCVALRARAWVETSSRWESILKQEVALRARAWVETWNYAKECHRHSVALRARAWVETLALGTIGTSTGVALRARAWVETSIQYS